MESRVSIVGPCLAVFHLVFPIKTLPLLLPSEEVVSLIDSLSDSFSLDDSLQPSKIALVKKTLIFHYTANQGGNRHTIA